MISRERLKNSIPAESPGNSCIVGSLACGILPVAEVTTLPYNSIEMKNLIALAGLLAMIVSPIQAQENSEATVYVADMTGVT
jgi:hypothetical protein